MRFSRNDTIDLIFKVAKKKFLAYIFREWRSACKNFDSHSFWSQATQIEWSVFWRRLPIIESLILENIVPKISGYGKRYLVLVILGMREVSRIPDNSSCHKQWKSFLFGLRELQTCMLQVAVQTHQGKWLVPLLLIGSCFNKALVS